MGHGGRPKAELVLSTEERLTLERLAPFSAPSWRKSGVRTGNSA